MIETLCDGRKIDIFVDENKNIAIFSVSKQECGDVIDFLPVMPPYELTYPYKIEDLAKFIEKAIDGWCKDSPYCNKKNTIEEHYYKMNGFQNATVGKRLISSGWHDLDEKYYVALHFPTKKGKHYLTVKRNYLPDNADWIDFADAVLNLINLDVTTLNAYKTYKKSLNI